METAKGFPWAIWGIPLTSCPHVIHHLPEFHPWEGINGLCYILVNRGNLFSFLRFVNLRLLNAVVREEMVSFLKKAKRKEKRKNPPWFFLKKEYHQEQAMINTHNWSKLQLTAANHLPAVDRRKLLTAFSHSVEIGNGSGEGASNRNLHC